MPRTLYARLSISLAALLVVVGILFAVLTISATRNYLQEVNQRFNRNLARDLFELAKLDAMDTHPSVEPVSLADLAQDVVQKFRLAAQAKGVRLALEGTGDRPFVKADVGLIERVLKNLIDNAIRHTSEDRGISVSTRVQGQTVTVRVSDTGRGIPPEDLPRVFDCFFQGSASGRGEGHAGLGLAIAKRIIELHDSSLRVFSELGEGTTFSFSLPIWTPGSEPSTAHPAAELFGPCCDQEGASG